MLSILCEINIIQNCQYAFFIASSFRKIAVVLYILNSALILPCSRKQTQFLRWSPVINIASFSLETESVICQQSTVARLYYRCDNDPKHGLKPHCCGCPRNPCTGSSVCRADKCRCPRNPCTHSFVCHADKRCCPHNPCTGFFVCHADKCRCPRNPCTYSFVCHADNAAAPFSFWKAFRTDFPSRRDVLMRLSETRVLFPARLHQRATSHCEAAAACRFSSAAAHDDGC